MLDNGLVKALSEFSSVCSSFAAKMGPVAKIRCDEELKSILDACKYQSDIYQSVIHEPLTKSKNSYEALTRAANAVMNTTNWQRLLGDSYVADVVKFMSNNGLAGIKSCKNIQVVAEEAPGTMSSFAGTGGESGFGGTGDMGMDYAKPRPSNVKTKNKKDKKKMVHRNKPDIIETYVAVEAFFNEDMGMWEINRLDENGRQAYKPTYAKTKSLTKRLMKEFKAAAGLSGEIKSKKLSAKLIEFAVTGDDKNGQPTSIILEAEDAEYAVRQAKVLEYFLMMFVLIQD